MLTPIEFSTKIKYAAGANVFWGRGGGGGGVKGKLIQIAQEILIFIACVYAQTPPLAHINSKRGV